MKTLVIAAALSFLAVPAFAGISDVDHPDVPNCTIAGPNEEGCETLTMQAVYPPSGLWKHKLCHEECGERVCVISWY